MNFFNIIFPIILCFIQTCYTIDYHNNDNSTIAIKTIIDNQTLHVCFGTLIEWNNTKFIITAAHCCNSKAVLYVENTIIDKCIMNDQFINKYMLTHKYDDKVWSPFNTGYDIAIIKVNIDWNLSNYSSIILENSLSTNNTFQEYDYCYSLNQEFQLRIVGSIICTVLDNSISHGNKLLCVMEPLCKNNLEPICLSGKGGYSGSGLFCYNRADNIKRLIGVTSGTLIQKSIFNRCVYYFVNVDYHFDWITNNILSSN